MQSGARVKNLHAVRHSREESPCSPVRSPTASPSFRTCVSSTDTTFVVFALRSYFLLIDRNLDFEHWTVTTHAREGYLRRPILRHTMTLVTLHLPSSQTAPEVCRRRSGPERHWFCSTGQVGPLLRSMVGRVIVVGLEIDRWPSHCRDVCGSGVNCVALNCR